MLNLAFNNSTVVDPNSNHNDDSDFENTNDQHGFMGIIGQSKKMQEVYRLIEQVADSDSTILINGKSGTGKELVAKAIHKTSYRKNKPFIPINCGAIPQDLLESELFGHVRGAFTGATAPKAGKFEMAHGGTIFLDEIGDMSHDLQVKVLRVLEEREFYRVGGSKSVKVDVRIVAATHRNLEEEVEKGNFREDLFYRLYVIPIELPSLKARKSDISVLIDYFLDKFQKQNNSKIEEIADDAKELMIKYSWPGNVRELKNIIERLVVLKRDGRITCNDLPHKMRCKADNLIPIKMDMLKDGICLNTAVSEFEKALIFQSLEKTKWVKNKAAKLLQMNRTTLVEKIKRHHLKPQKFQQCSMF